MSELYTRLIESELDLKKYPGITLGMKVAFISAAEISASSLRVERDLDLPRDTYFYKQMFFAVAGGRTFGGGLVPSMGSDADFVAYGLNPDLDQKVIAKVKEDFEGRTGISMDVKYLQVLEHDPINVGEYSQDRFDFKKKPHNLGILDQVARGGNARGWGANTIYFDGIRHHITKEDLRRIALYDSLAEGVDKSSGAFSRSDDPYGIKYGYGGERTIMGIYAIYRILNKRKYGSYPLTGHPDSLITDMVKDGLLNLNNAKKLLLSQSDLVLVKSYLWYKGKGQEHLQRRDWYKINYPDVHNELLLVKESDIPGKVKDAKKVIVDYYEKVKRRFLESEGLWEIYKKVQQGKLSFGEAEELGKLKPDVFILMAWEARDSKTLEFVFEKSKNDWLVGLAIAKSKFATVDLLDKVLKVNEEIWTDDYIKRIIDKNRELLKVQTI